MAALQLVIDDCALVFGFRPRTPRRAQKMRKKMKKTNYIKLHPIHQMIPNDNSTKSDKTSMDAMNVWCPYKPWSQTQGMAPTSYHSSTERQVPRKGLFLQSKHKLTNQHDQHCMLKIVEVHVM
jgi:hypothetical protein